MDLLAPLPQSPQFVRCCDLLNIPVQALYSHDDGRLTGRCQAQLKSMPAIGRVALISRGPVGLTNSDSPWPARLQRHFQRASLVLNAQKIGVSELRAAGFLPVMTPATVAMMDLTTPGAMRRALKQKWRNRLNRAEQERLTIRQTALPRDNSHWLLKHERSQQKQRRYRGWPPEFSLAYAHANPEDTLLVTAFSGSVPVAAMLFLCHGLMATYQIGACLPAGRHCNAHNLVLWHAACTLAERGMRQIDLGTLNTQDAAGLARFKLGTGARAEQLGGTWLYNRRLAPIARRMPQVLAA